MQSSHPAFAPFPLLKNGHVMTIASAFWPRHLKLTPDAKARLFEVEPGSQVLCWHHRQSKSAPTLLLLHGLNGSSQGHYMLGTALKAAAAGMNVLRMNMRNCGDTLHLTPSLYNSGMSGDVLEVVRGLKQEGVQTVFIAGWSMGGNIVLKLAAELGAKAKEYIAGVCAISPAIDLGACVDALEKRSNRLYHQRFLSGLKRMLLAKARLYGDLYDTSHLPEINSIRQFDDLYTAPSGGYGTAANYYKLASALPLIESIAVPTLIIHAKDDPFVPFETFSGLCHAGNNLAIFATEHGGHAAFIQARKEGGAFDRFWAENRLVAFFSQLSRLLKVI